MAKNYGIKGMTEEELAAKALAEQGIVPQPNIFSRGWDAANNWFDDNIVDFNNLFDRGPTTSGFTKQVNNKNWIDVAKDTLSGEQGVCTFQNGIKSGQFTRKSCIEAGGSWSNKSTVEQQSIENIQEGASQYLPAQLKAVPLLWDLGKHYIGNVQDAYLDDLRAERAGVDVTSPLFKQYGTGFLSPENYMDGTDERGVQFGAEGPLSTKHRRDADGNILGPSEWDAFQTQGAKNYAAEIDRLRHLPRTAQQIESGEYFKSPNESLFEDIQARNQRMLGQPPLEEGLPSGSPWRPQSPNPVGLLGTDNENKQAYETSDALRMAENLRFMQESKDRATDVRLAKESDPVDSTFGISHNVTGNADIDMALSKGIEIAQAAGTMVGENVEKVEGIIQDALPNIKVIVDEAKKKVVSLAKGLGDKAQSLFDADLDSAETWVLDKVPLADETANNEYLGGPSVDDALASGVVGGAIGTSAAVIGKEPTSKAEADSTVAKVFSSEGFTMDRLKNPFSPENKAWWLEERPGDIPGNNRAVEFFNALAYIGTPWKYRPAKTPTESLQERKLQHANNVLDAQTAQYTALNTAATKSYTQLKNMILQPSELQNRLLTDDETDSWFKRKFGEGMTEQQKIAESWRQATVINQLMHELAIKGIPPTWDNAKKEWEVRDIMEEMKMSRPNAEAEWERRKLEAEQGKTQKNKNNNEPGIRAKVASYFKVGV